MIYKGQTKLEFVVTVGANLTSASTAAIKYIKPSGLEGSFACTISNTTTGVINYTVGTSDINEYGSWIFYSYITFNDGKIAIGKAIKIPVLKQGQLV